MPSHDSPWSPSQLKRMWQFAWPVMLTNLSIPLLSLVDTALLGHLDNAQQLGAVAIGGNIIAMLLWVFSFLRQGTTGLSAIAYGAEDNLQSTLLLMRSCCLALTLSLTLLLAGTWLIPLISGLVGADAALTPLATRYAELRLLSAPAALLMMVISGWFLGQQLPRVALWIVVGTNFLNIGLDIIFISVIGWGAEGAAVATVIAEYLGLGIAILALVKHREILHPAKIEISELAAGMPALLQTNQYLFIRTLLLMGCFLFFTAVGARQGEIILAANAILMNLMLTAAFGLDGITVATEALVGERIGAKDEKGFYRTCITSGVWCAGLASFTTTVFWLLGTEISGLFTDLESVRNELAIYLNWLIFLPVAAFLAYVMDGIFIGAGQTKAMRNSMLISTLLVFVPVYYFAQPLANHGLWLAFYSWNIARALTLSFTFRQLYKSDGWIDRATHD